MARTCDNNPTVRGVKGPVYVYADGQVARVTRNDLLSGRVPADAPLLAGCAAAPDPDAFVGAPAAGQVAAEMRDGSAARQARWQPGGRVTLDDGGRPLPLDVVAADPTSVRLHGPDGPVAQLTATSHAVRARVTSETGSGTGSGAGTDVMLAAADRLGRDAAAGVPVAVNVPDGTPLPDGWVPVGRDPFSSGELVVARSADAALLRPLVDRGPRDATGQVAADTRARQQMLAGDADNLTQLRSRAPRATDDLETAALRAGQFDLTSQRPLRELVDHRRQVVSGYGQLDQAHARAEQASSDLAAAADRLASTLGTDGQHAAADEYDQARDRLVRAAGELTAVGERQAQLVADHLDGMGERGTQLSEQWMRDGREGQAYAWQSQLDTYLHDVKVEHTLADDLAGSARRVSASVPPPSGELVGDVPVPVRWPSPPAVAGRTHAEGSSPADGNSTVIGSALHDVLGAPVGPAATGPTSADRQASGAARFDELLNGTPASR